VVKETRERDFSFVGREETAGETEEEVVVEEEGTEDVSACLPCFQT